MSELQFGHLGVTFDHETFMERIQTPAFADAETEGRREVCVSWAPGQATSCWPQTRPSGCGLSPLHLQPRLYVWLPLLLSVTSGESLVTGQCLPSSDYIFLEGRTDLLGFCLFVFWFVGMFLFLFLFLLYSLLPRLHTSNSETA